MRSSFQNESNKQSYQNLPVDEYKRSLLYLLETNDVLIVAGDTGSGKSTRIPAILLSAGIYNSKLEPISDEESSSNSGCRQICVTQPRRVAASHLALRVSQEHGSELGSLIGYSIRFKDVTSPDTRLKYMTEGLLLREMLIDPLLKKYSVIMVDEVHERNLNSDILLSLLKCILRKRNKDLKLIICSATMNIEEFRKFFTQTCEFNNSTEHFTQEPAVLCIKGKTHPLKIYHRSKPVADYVEATIETIIDIHEDNRLGSGKILAFLTGQEEVDYVCDKLSDYAQASSSRLDLRKLIVLPLYASLKSHEISKVFDEHGRNSRVCIVATNIAETSLTINNIGFVVDCGFTKLKFYDYRTGIDSLRRVAISKGAAKQRAGRAGRTRNGVVYRLYEEDEYKLLDEDTLPEIQRTSLVEPIMLLKSLGVRNPQRFPLLSPMPRNNVIAALDILYALGTLNETGQLTPEGEAIAQLNLDPKIAKFLLYSGKVCCSREASMIAAMLQIKEVYVKPRRGTNSIWSNENLTKICASEGDLPSYLNFLNAFLTNDRSQRWADKRNLNYQGLINAVEISKRIESQLKRLNVQISSCSRLETIQRCLVFGLFSNSAYLHPCGDYKTIRGDQTLYIHPTSIFSELIDRPKYVVFVDILHTTKAYMLHMMAIDQKWLLDAAPHFYTLATELDMIQS